MISELNFLSGSPTLQSDIRCAVTVDLMCVYFLEDFWFIAVGRWHQSNRSVVSFVVV
jgi:hypothetical protein